VAHKAELRSAALAARDALDPAARQAASAVIARALLALPELAEARLVGAFWPIRSEVDPRPAAEGLLARGQAVALPHVTPDGLVFREWRLPLRPQRAGSRAAPRRSRRPDRAPRGF
jgi:5-formyltetrahydrofolate cyclo-ligase